MSIEISSNMPAPSPEGGRSVGTCTATTSMPALAESKACWMRSRRARTSESPRGESTESIGCVER